MRLYYYHQCTMSGTMLGASNGANVNVIGKSELERIRASILPPVEDRRAYEKKCRLKAMSQVQIIFISLHKIPCHALVQIFYLILM